MKLSVRYCGNFELISFLWEFEKESLLEHCKYKEWMSFFWVHGVWIIARNKQITREPLRGSRDLFVPRYDSYPMNPEKKDTHSLIGKVFNKHSWKRERLNEIRECHRERSLGYDVYRDDVTLYDVTLLLFIFVSKVWIGLCHRHVKFQYATSHGLRDIQQLSLFLG